MPKAALAKAAAAAPKAAAAASAPVGAKKAAAKAKAAGPAATLSDAAAAAAGTGAAEAVVVAGEGEGGAEEEESATLALTRAWLEKQLQKQKAPDELALCFRGQQGDEALEELAASLPADLTSLELEFTPASQPSDQGLKRLAKALKKQQALVRCELRCNLCVEVSDAGMVALYVALMNHKGLERLVLDLSLCVQVEDKSLKMLSELLKVRQDTLGHLTLNLHGCARITDEGLIALGEGFFKLQMMRTLDLSLAQMNQACSSVGWKELFHGLTTMTEVEHLALNLSDCPAFYDSGFVAMGMNLAGKEHLTRLSINTAKSYSLTPQALLSLKDVFKQSPKLEFVTLHLTECGKITNKGLDDLSRFLSTIPALLGLTLHLGGTQVTLDCILGVETELKHVGSLKISKMVRQPLGVGVG